MDRRNTQPNLPLAITSALAGLLCAILVPVITSQAMDAILRGIPPKVAASGNPLLASAPKIVIGFFPLWNGLTVAAGMGLLVVAWGFYKGESWARPVGIGLLAIPAVTGAYYSGPTMAFAKSKMFYFVLVALIGLVPYFILLLSEKGTGREKATRFFLFLMLGVTAAWSFSNGGSSLRMFMARPEPVSILDRGNLGFLLGFPPTWIGMFITLISIPLIAARKPTGPLLASAGLLSLLMGNLTLFIHHPGTQEFLIGVVMAVVTLTTLWWPAASRSRAVGRQAQPA